MPDTAADVLRLLVSTGAFSQSDIMAMLPPEAQQIFASDQATFNQMAAFVEQLMPQWFDQFQVFVTLFNNFSAVGKASFIESLIIAFGKELQKANIDPSLFR